MAGRDTPSLFGNPGDGPADEVPEAGPAPDSPLAERMRPRSLDEYVGQEHLVGPGRLVRKLVERAGPLPSMVLWGGPGTGKTTLARLLARPSGVDFVPISAVLSGVKELREAIAGARQARRLGRRTVLFIDEIHRFNKSQQDALLPAVEDGTVSLIGATTENPSFEVNAALLSRSRVLTLQPLAPADVNIDPADRALADRERGLAALESRSVGTRPRPALRRRRGRRPGCAHRARIGRNSDRSRPGRRPSNRGPDPHRSRRPRPVRVRQRGRGAL